LYFLSEADAHRSQRLDNAVVIVSDSLRFGFGLELVTEASVLPVEVVTELWVSDAPHRLTLTVDDASDLP
jgi:hypothetical protein